MKKEIKEYAVYSVISAIVYLIPMIYYLSSRQFSMLYWLFIGNFLFGTVIAIYTTNTINRNKTEEPVSLMRQGQIATICGTTCTVLLSVITVLIFFGDVSVWHHGEPAVTHLPGTFMTHSLSPLLWIIFSDILIGNISVGTFVSALTVSAEKGLRRW